MMKTTVASGGKLPGPQLNTRCPPWCDILVGLLWWIDPLWCVGLGGLSDELTPLGAMVWVAIMMNWPHPKNKKIKIYISAPWIMAYIYKNSVGFGLNWLEQKIVPIKVQTFISWSQLLATEVVTHETSKPYLVCSFKFI